MKRKFNQNLSGNKVYHTNSLALVAKNMLCSRLHCQKSFNLILFPYKITGVKRCGQTLKGTPPALILFPVLEDWGEEDREWEDLYPKPLKP